MQKTCSDCQTISPRCGWCDDDSGTGLGRCIPGMNSGPLDASVCSSSQWYFTGEPGFLYNNLFLKFILKNVNVMVTVHVLVIQLQIFCVENV